MRYNNYILKGILHFRLGWALVVTSSRQSVDIKTSVYLSIVRGEICTNKENIELLVINTEMNM